LPQALNPESGLIATANARVVGPLYKPYLTDRWEEPYRTARIYDLLHESPRPAAEDMLKVETTRIVIPTLLSRTNCRRPQKSLSQRPSRPKTHRWPERLERKSRCRFSGSFFRSCRPPGRLDILLEPSLGKESNLYQWRGTAFLQKILTDRPAKWLPSGTRIMTNC